MHVFSKVLYTAKKSLTEVQGHNQKFERYRRYVDWAGLVTPEIFGPEAMPTNYWNHTHC